MAAVTFTNDEYYSIVARTTTILWAGIVSFGALIGFQINALASENLNPLIQNLLVGGIQTSLYALAAFLVAGLLWYIAISTVHTIINDYEAYIVWVFGIIVFAAIMFLFMAFFWPALEGVKLFWENLNLLKVT